MARISSYVGDLVSGNGSWNVGYLKNLLSNDICIKICSEVPPISNNISDRVVWGNQSNGMFSVRSAYCYKITNMPTLPIFKLNWNIDVPDRVNILVWLMAHDRVPARELCNTWFSGFAWCEHCPSFVESSLHFFS